MDKFTVRAVDGSVDVMASAASYTNALAKWVSENEMSTESVRDAVDAVFDEHPSADPKVLTRLTIPVLVSYTIAKLNPSPAQFSACEARIRAFVKGSERFDSSKGKGGGVARLCLEGEQLAKTC